MLPTRAGFNARAKVVVPLQYSGAGDHMGHPGNVARQVTPGNVWVKFAKG